MENVSNELLLKNTAAHDILITNGADPSMENVSNELLLKNTAAQDILITNDADPNIFSAEKNKNKADQSEIMAIKTELRHSLLSIASKLLKSKDTRLHHLSLAEQDLWNSFEKADIYEFLTGEKDTIPEFQFNWISPEAPLIHLVPGASQLLLNLQRQWLHLCNRLRYLLHLHQRRCHYLWNLLKRRSQHWNLNQI